MNHKLEKLLKEIEDYGLHNDKDKSLKEERMRNVTPETGEFLSMLVRITRASTILEIGTSNGYSTLWLASSLNKGGVVHTVEIAQNKANLAHENFERSGLQHLIDLHVMDAGEFLSNQRDNSADIIFLDSDRYHYNTWLQNLKRVIKPGGLIVIDNVISHHEELEEFINTVKNMPEVTTNLVTIGCGLFIVHFD